jgi:PAS domain S-box-containing protein
MLVSSWFVKQLNNTRLSEALAHETRQSLLQGIINNAPALIAVKDRQGRYTMINQGLRDEWGPAAESLLGRTGPEVSPDKVFSKKMHEQDMRLMQDEENNTALEKFPHKPNKTYYTTRFPLYDTHNNVVGLGGVSLDVTELTDARSTIEKQNRELAASIQELQRFAQITAHDLQEPLRMMTSFSEMLLQNLGTTVEGENLEHLEFIARNARRSQKQIKDLLVYSNLQVCAEPACVELDVIVQAAARNVATNPESQVICCTGLPQISGDAKQLQKLFEHLFENALKFNEAQDPRIEVSSVERGPQRVDVMVSDNGIGVDTAHADHIFEIFT